MQPELLQALQAVKAGAVEEFASVVEAFWPALSAYVGACGLARADADDLVERAFVKAWRGLPQLRELGRFRAWLYMIARNLVRDHQRRLQRERKTMLEYAYIAPKSVQAPSQDDRLGLLNHLVPRLKDVERQILSLRFAEDKNCKQIAEILAMKHATVRSTLHRALKALRQGMQDKLAARGQGGKS